MKFSRLKKAIELPESHIKDDMKEFDTLLDNLNQDEDIVQKMKQEDQDALKTSSSRLAFSSNVTVSEGGTVYSDMGNGTQLKVLAIYTDEGLSLASYTINKSNPDRTVQFLVEFLDGQYAGQRQTYDESALAPFVYASMEDLVEGMENVYRELGIII